MAKASVSSGRASGTKSIDQSEVWYQAARPYTLAIPCPPSAPFRITDPAGGGARLLAWTSSHSGPLTTTVADPETSPDVAVTRVVPAARPVTRPETSTAAMASSPDAHATAGPSTTAPEASRSETFAWTEEPTPI